MRMSPRRTFIENDELKNLRLADLAARAHVDRGQVQRFEMQPIRDHQLDVAPSRAAAIIRRHSSTVTAIGFSQSTCTPGSRRANRVLGVHRVRQRDVDRIHHLQTFIVLVVGEGMLQPISLGDLTPLGSVAAHDGEQFRVPPCMRETWQYGDLCDVAKAHDCVPNAFFRHGILL